MSGRVAVAYSIHRAGSLRPRRSSVVPHSPQTGPVSALTVQTPARGCSDTRITPRVVVALSTSRTPGRVSVTTTPSVRSALRFDQRNGKGKLLAPIATAALNAPPDTPRTAYALTSTVQPIVRTKQELPVVLSAVATFNITSHSANASSTSPSSVGTAQTVAASTGASPFSTKTASHASTAPTT